MKFFKQLKMSYLVYSLILIAGGLCFLICPKISAAAICTVWGVFLMILGVLKIAGYFTKDLYGLAFQFDLAGGILDIILSAVLIFASSMVMKITAIVIGVSIIINSVMKIQTAFEAKRFGMRYWWGLLILAVLCGGIGVFVLCFPFQTAEFFVRFVGISIIVTSVLNIYTVLTTFKESKPFIETEYRNLDD